MKNTQFTEIHKTLGAKMVEFAGYTMPIQYPGGIIHEHQVIRNSVGVFDVSHMGEFEVTGKDALKFLQKITINDVAQLRFGKVQYTAMCYEDGGIIDDLLLYNMGDYSYMMVVNASNIDKDLNWCLKNAEGFDVNIKNVSDDISLLAIQGPNSVKTLQKLTEIDISEESLPFYHFKLGKLTGVDMIISRTGYTGELGFELYFRTLEGEAQKVWDAIFEAGKEFDIEPVGLGCRDTLRLEKGYCLYGNDIDETTNPIEAGLGWITKLNKGDFNGSGIIKKVKEEKPRRKLVGFIATDDKFIPRKSYRISANELEIGYVTSGNLSPTLSKPIGMGYVSKDFATVGSKISIMARGREFSAEVVKIPFV